MVMLNLHVRPSLNRLLAPAGRGLARLGVTPNAVTIVGTVGVVGGALGFYPRGDFLTGSIVITVFVFCDMLDGAVARARGAFGPFGAFLDSTLDRFGDAAIFGALAMWYAGGGHSRLMAAVALYDLVAAFVTSYAKARAESLDLSCNVGLVERSERLLAILVATGFTGIFGVPALEVVVLWVLAGAMTVTVAQRVVEVHRQAVRAGPARPGTAAPPAPSPPSPSATRRRGAAATPGGPPQPAQRTPRAGPPPAAAAPGERAARP
jgi:CDP-diacylglycerol--glycerol-3-phosphate 3-phosphatidyltransferase